MQSRLSVGRVGSLAVALGVGAAVFTGWGCAVASADTTGGETSSASDDAGAEKPATKKTREKADRADERDADDAHENDAPARADDPDERAETDDSDEDERSTKSEVRAISSPVVDESDLAAPDDVPAAASHLLPLVAAARREVEDGPSAKSLQHNVDAQLVGTEPAAATAPANSVTVTPPPTFSDRLVVAGFEFTRFISDVLGVDVNAVANSFSSSARPPWFVRIGLDVRETTYDVADGSEWTVWEFHPPEPTGQKVVAFHGGGYIEQPNLLLWSDYSTMAKDTGATVVVPLYPLATTAAGRATEVIPVAADFISHQIELHGAENVSVYGDSAGSALAIGAVRLLALAGKAMPASMVVLSLTADGSLRNPDIREIDDPIFNVDNLDAYESHWYDGIDRDDPLVSPLFAEPEVFRALPPTTLYVGEREIAYPDTLLLQQKWSAAGGTVSTVVGQGLTHDWALSSMFFAQSRAVRPDIYRQLRLTGVTGGPATKSNTPSPFCELTGISLCTSGK